MSDKKRFRHTWHEFRLNERGGFLAPTQNSTQKGIGQAPAVKDLPPKEQLAIAVIVDEIDRKPPDKCDPEALTDSDPLNIVVMQSVNENGMNFLGRQVTCAMIDSDVNRVGGFFEWAQSPNCAQLLQPATNFTRQNLNEFFGLKQLQQAAPAGITERDQAAFTDKFGGDSRFDSLAPDPTVVEPTGATPEEPEQESQPLATQSALKTLAHNYFEGKLEDLFKCLTFDHIKFILAIGIVTYWETLIEQDFLGLKKTPELFRNARMIAEIEINWLRRIIITPLAPKIEQARIEDRKALKQIAMKEPEALKQLQLNGPKTYKQLTLKGDPEEVPGVRYEYYVEDPPFSTAPSTRPAYEKMKEQYGRAHPPAGFDKDFEEFVNFLGQFKGEKFYLEEAESKIEKLADSDYLRHRKKDLVRAFAQLPKNHGAYKILTALGDVKRTSKTGAEPKLDQIAQAIMSKVKRRKVGPGVSALKNPPAPGTAPPEKPAAKTGSGFPEGGGLEEQKQNNRWKQLAGI